MIFFTLLLHTAMAVPLNSTVDYTYSYNLKYKVRKTTLKTSEDETTLKTSEDLSFAPLVMSVNTTPL
jgi:hypothetical protein